MNIVCKSLFGCVFILFHRYLGVELLGYIVSLHLKCLRNYQVFTSFYILNSNVSVFKFLSILAGTYIFSFITILGYKIILFALP